MKLSNHGGQFVPPTDLRQADGSLLFPLSCFHDRGTTGLRAVCFRMRDFFSFGFVHSIERYDV